MTSAGQLQLQPQHQDRRKNSCLGPPQGCIWAPESQRQNSHPPQDFSAQHPHSHTVPFPDASASSREGRERPQRLTVDEAKAGAVQVVVLQVVIPGTAVSAPQHLLPARHSSDEGEVIAPALPAQNSLGLGDRHAAESGSSPPLSPQFFCFPLSRRAPHLVHLRTVLQAAAEGVPGEAGHDDEQGVEAAVDGGQDDCLGQPGIRGDLGQAFAQRGEGFSLVQHSCNRAAHEGTAVSSKGAKRGSQPILGAAKRHTAQAPRTSHPQGEGPETREEAGTARR